MLVIKDNSPATQFALPKPVPVGIIYTENSSVVSIVQAK
jgi:hypothetical protein